MKIRKNNAKLVLCTLAVVVASWLPTTASAGLIFDFIFEAQNGVPNTVNGTIAFSTENSDDGGDVTLDYTGTIFTYVDTDWALDTGTTRWDFSDTSNGLFPVYDVVARWTVPGSGGSFFGLPLPDDAFSFLWNPTNNGFIPSPDILFSRDGGTFANGTYTGPTAVPEPSMLSLLGAGLLVAGFGTARRRKRKVL